MEVYVFDIAALEGREEAVLARLSPERREKALRLRPGKERLRSMAAGLLLRRYVGDGPFVFGPQGKPSLPGGPHFSLSHSGGFALLALDGEELGADIQSIAPPREALLRRVLTDQEARWLREDPAGRFTFLWTRKEAVLKWDGCGISYPLRALSVLPGERPCLHGRSCDLHSVEYHGTWISAAGRDPAFVPRAVSWEEVIR